MLLALETLNSIDEVLITHELGHWVLRLQGFESLQNEHKRNGSTEMHLNSLAQHPALYALQRELGHEPQTEIDSRAAHNLKLVRSGEFDRSRAPVDDALHLADDMLNCSDSISRELEETLRSRLPKLLAPIEAIRGARMTFPPLTPNRHKRFLQRVAQEMGLKAGWNFVQEAQVLRKKVNP